VKDELRKGTLKELATSRDLKPPRRIVYGIMKKGMRESEPLEGWLSVMKEHGFRVVRA
jgi:hypothetical protein